MKLEKFCQSFNGKPDAWLFLAKKENGRFIQRPFKKLTYLSQYQYFTPNEFYTRLKRSNETIRWLNAFFLDIDNHSSFTGDITTRINDLNLPHPTAIVRTPHGLHFHWILKKPLGGSKKEIQIWRHYQRRLIEAFKDLGADIKCNDPPRFMRLPKTPKDLLFFAPEGKITLDQIKEPLKCPDSDDKKQKRKKVANRPGNFKNRGFIRFFDNQVKGVPQGQRNVTGFKLAILLKHNGRSQEDTLRFLKMIWNPKNLPPLPEQEIDPTVRGVYQHNYPIRFSIKKLATKVGGIEFNKSNFSPSPELQVKILKTIRRNGCRLVIKQQDLAKRLNIGYEALRRTLYLLRDYSLLNMPKYSVNRGSCRGATHITALTLREKASFQSSPGIDNRERGRWEGNLTPSKRAFKAFRVFKEVEVRDFFKGRKNFETDLSPPP